MWLIINGRPLNTDNIEEITPVKYLPVSETEPSKDKQYSFEIIERPVLNLQGEKERFRMTFRYDTRVQADNALNMLVMTLNNKTLVQFRITI